MSSGTADVKMAHSLRQENDTWFFGEARITELVRDHGTPTFAYDANRARSQLRSLRSVLPLCVDVYYSIKANPNPCIARLFVEMGAGIEIASAAEYLAARKAGAATDNIVFAGPGKSEDELKFVINAGIGEIHIESEEEIAAIERCGRPQKVSVRFNPAKQASGGAMRMGGQPSQFGFDEEQLPRIVEKIADSNTLRFQGIHMFAGTQLLDADVLVGQWQHAISVARRIARIIGAPLKTIDLGGGLGIPYFKNEKELDLDRVRETVSELFESVLGDPLFDGSKFILEPGRFLIGSAGIYLARVLSIKQSRGTSYVVLDGGMNHHLAASGNLGQVIKRDYPIVNVSRSKRDKMHEVVVVGPLCTPLDTLGRKVLLPSTTAAGDVIAVMQSGAYGLTASPVGFLSHPTPAEVLIEGDSVTRIRDRGTFETPIAVPL